ncbi:MAG: rhamnose ABC transporter substrate-binding protein [Tepidanaerobacteraceae bacterium]|nr:rhamnose ABC transporter substrate-binding protein [Tepidanaerobacteraceae bacterium]
MKKTSSLMLALVIALSVASSGCGRTAQISEAKKAYTIGMIVKGLGNPFMEACGKGFEEALKEYGDRAIYQGPSIPTAEGQIEIIENFIAQKIDAIVITANDAQAVVPALKKAMDAGIKVISFDSSVAAEGRLVHVNQADAKLIGRLQIQAMAEMIDYKGEIAILSAGATMTNQNAWIKYMEEELRNKKYSGMKLVTVVYGDDLRDKSYNEAMGLFKAYPNLKGIIAPTAVGLAAAANAITDAGLIGKVKLTGLGLPSEMAQWIKNGACESMFLWNPVDLGYLAGQAAHSLVTGEITGKVGEKFIAGKLGEREIIKDPTGGVQIMLGFPFKFDKSNIDKWKDIY